MLFKKKKDKELNDVKFFDYYNNLIKLEEEKGNDITRNCNTLIISNTIFLIPLLFGIIESIKNFEQAKTLIIIFGLILIGIVLVSNFFAFLAGYFYSFDFTNKDQEILDIDIIYNKKSRNNILRKKLMLVSCLSSLSTYILLFIFIMVVMIVL